MQSQRRDIFWESRCVGSFNSQYAHSFERVSRMLNGRASHAQVHLINATMEEDVPGSRADVSTRAWILFQKGVVARLIHSPLGSGFNIVARGTMATMTVYNYWTAFIYHHIRQVLCS